MKERRGNSFIEEKGKLKGAVCKKKVHWRKPAVRSIVVFIGWAVARGGENLPPAGVSSSFLPEMQGTFLSFEI